MTTEEFIRELSKDRPETARMLEWSKHWLETEPLLGEETKKVLLSFCK
jgi:hypothetical protein